MTSNINPTVPALGGAVDSAEIRDNFAAAYEEISALQASVGGAAWPRASTSSVSAGSGTTLAAGSVVPSFVGGVTLLSRSGPSTSFVDTTDSATSIIGGMTGAITGSSFQLVVLNDTTALQTIDAGAGVTFSGALDNGAFSVGPQSSRTLTFVVSNVGALTMTVYG